MKKIKRIFFILFLMSGLYLNAQTVIPLKTGSDIDKIKNDAAGNIYIINLWATWCKPCVEEFPGLVQLYRDYEQKGVKLFFISVDEPSELEKSIIPFLKNQNVDFVTYFNSFDKMDDFINYIDMKWDGSIPMTYIYDKSGILYKGFLGSRSYEFFKNELDNLLISSKAGN